MKITSISTYKSSSSFKSNNVFSTFNTLPSPGIKPLQPDVKPNPPVIAASNNVFLPATVIETDPKKINKQKIAAIVGATAGALAVGFGILKALKNKRPPESIVKGYQEVLAEGLTKMLNKEVKPEALSCVVGKKEFLEIIPKLTEQNYVFTPENVEKGLFRADLHSHSNFSDGVGEVKELLNQAAEYGDKLFAKTKEKFVFALTDHDGVEGVKEALGHIAENPDKFKNIKFVPGCELSFVHAVDKSSNPTETSEVLAYCINPFSDKLDAFFKNIYKKREGMFNDFISQLSEKFPSTKFSIDEFSKAYNVTLPKDTFAMNSHWRIHHYGQTKLAVSDFAKEQYKNPEKLYEEIMAKTQRGKALGNLKDMQLIPNHFNENDAIIDIRKALQPRVNTDGSITAASENTLSEIFDVFAKDDEVVMSFAHPYYLSERLHNPQGFIQEAVKKSNGLIKATESYHQAYSPNMNKTDISRLNTICENENLIPIGGRDNHLPSLF